MTMKTPDAWNPAIKFAAQSIPCNIPQQAAERLTEAIIMAFIDQLKCDGIAHVGYAATEDEWDGDALIIKIGDGNG